MCCWHPSHAIHVVLPFEVQNPKKGTTRCNNYDKVPLDICVFYVFLTINPYQVPVLLLERVKKSHKQRMIDSCSWIVSLLCLVECNLSNNIRLVIYLEGTVWIGQYYEMLIFSDREHKPVVFFGVAFVVSLVVSDTVVSAVSAVSGVISTPERYCFFRCTRYFNNISIWCNISRYFNAIFKCKLGLNAPKFHSQNAIFATKLPIYRVLFNAKPHS